MKWVHKLDNPEFSHWLKEEPFTLDIDRNQLIIETEYYRWLEQNSCDNMLQDKIAFLRFKGFSIGLDSLSSKDLNSLHAIEDMFYFNLFLGARKSELLSTIN